MAFLILPGVAVLLFSMYVNAWMFIHFFDALAAPETRTASQAFARAYAPSPHTFITALLSLMLAIQLIGLGVLALQSQKYFEEVFYLGSAVRRLLGSPRNDTQL